MDEMTAFDQQIAREVLREAGPSEPVDAAAIFGSMTAATRSPRWRLQTMFTATKFVVAGVLVALFGSFLINGVLMQTSSDVGAPSASASFASPPAHATLGPTSAPETSTARDLLPGVELVTEKIEPGVFRVLHDGIRPLAKRFATPEGSDKRSGHQPGVIVAGLDGSIWHFWKDRFVRFGDAAIHDLERPPGGGPLRGRRLWADVTDDIEVGPDGIVWDLNGSNDGSQSLRSFDGRAWHAHAMTETYPVSVEVLADGTALLASSGGGRVTDMTLVDADGQITLLRSVPDPPGQGDLVAASDGGLWFLAYGGDRGQTFPLYSFDGERWQEVAAPDGQLDSMDVGGDGSVWLSLVPEQSARCLAEGIECDPPSVLARSDGMTWTEFDEEDGVPPMGSGSPLGYVPSLAAGQDGSVWLTPSDDGSGQSCDGIANFDGERLTRYLSDLCIWDMDLAPDGAVWLLAGASPVEPGIEELPMVDVYVIATNEGNAS